MFPLCFIEEIAVRELETIFSSAEEFNKWYAEISTNPELKSNWQKFCEWISQVIEDIKKVFMSEGKKAELAELENIKGLLANAIRGAENAAQEIANEVQAKQSAEAKSSTNLENQIKEEYNEVVSHSLKRKRTVYNEYQTNAMIWARDSSRQPGDLKILNRNGKDFVVIEATDDGFVELTSGKYEEVVAVYERIHGEKDTSFYEDTQEIRAEQNRNLWDLQYVENRGDATGNGEQIRSEELQPNTTGNDKHMRNGDKGESEQSAITNYSLKQWHTGLTKAQIEDVEKWVRRAGRPESKMITNKTYWYKGRLNGRDLFVIYSTENVDDPTVLYLERGKKAKVELNSLLNYMEDFESGKRKRFVRKSEVADKVLGGDWLQKKHSMAHNNDRSGKRGSNTGYASVLQGKSSKLIGSPAFRNVIEDCFRIQERDGGVNKNHSLKGGIQNPSKWTKEFLDTIEDVRDGKKNAESRLYKYVEDGTISTKDYDELVEKYGAIPSGENPHRDVQVPRKTADGKKVSQTVRTILEAKATPDEAVPTIEKMVEDGIFSYDAYTDKQAIKDAKDYLKEYGWNESLRDWLNDVEKGIVSKQHTAM